MTLTSAPVWRISLFGQQPRAPWVWIMALVTGAYLLVECGFNSRLLDVVGGMPDHAAVEAIEQYGRSLSGIALALVCWPWVLKRAASARWHHGLTALALLLLTIVIASAVYRAERALVDGIVERSGAEQRFLATNLVALQGALVSNKVLLDELPLTPEQLRAPDGKSFLAVFPLLALSTHELDRVLQAQKPAILRAMADQLHGGATQSYNHFIDARQELIATYNDHYVSASNAYQSSLDGIGARQDKAWNDYLARLRQRRVDPDNVPPAYWSDIRKDVRKRGVNVAKDWDPGDRAGFQRAVAQTVRSEAERRFRDGVGKHLDGHALPPGLAMRAFFNHPAVQAKWRKSLVYDNSSFVLPVDLPAPDQAPQFFNRTVYDRVLDDDVRATLPQYNAPVATFADGGLNEELGRESLRALAVPPIALGFSIVGALVHLVKLALFAIQLLAARGFTSGAVKGVCVPLLALLLLAVFHYIPTSEITRQPLYGYFEQRGAELGGSEANWQGRLAMYFTRSVIHAQVPAYPVFEAVRLHVLGGYEFGYSSQQKTAVVTGASHASN
jgi:hypothetical protein